MPSDENSTRIERAVNRLTEEDARENRLAVVLRLVDQNAGL
jgi:hypothetical protein